MAYCCLAVPCDYSQCLRKVVHVAGAQNIWKWVPAKSLRRTAGVLEISQCCNTAADLSEHFEKSYALEVQGR
eukprot:scaffold234337_cov21-Tisochrysis_lutea.AAC.1